MSDTGPSNVNAAGAAQSSPPRSGAKNTAAALTAKVWRAIEGDVMHASSMSEFVKLARLAFTMSHGSVDEERMFSTMKFIKKPKSNRLDAKHLTCCARILKYFGVSLSSFPNGEAAKQWAMRAHRQNASLGPVEGKATPQEPQVQKSPLLVNVSVRYRLRQA
jgi:hypothetical protein